MRKLTRLMILLVGAVFAALCVFLNGARWFRALEAEQLSQGYIYEAIDAEKHMLDDWALEEAVTLLNEVVILYKVGALPKDTDPSVTFLFEEQDGTRLVVEVNAFYISINGVAYRAKHIPCKALYQYGVLLRDAKQ